ncbi:LOW QUALITY PROTEIN: tumor necrosis factor alpha-induced protein 8-like protein 1 [Trichosurus vulpecula]|uniref:LOW QUALITY PROTEIN: tumor necrosis factor alpha-induced protein 8-like protein 1 n=1 Tax=Trichosurus vulpecula TaxID=9337 RepID=UPI00186ACB0D|nr:LOW QUALITY PROTEIN: tumor necrosis factor alpha-induced protein 8-like protein 1 [Trichosurus vulpecula]
MLEARAGPSVPLPGALPCHPSPSPAPRVGARTWGFWAASVPLAPGESRRRQRLSEGPGSSVEAGLLAANMDTFSTKNLALQAQKKLLSKMASKTMASVFIDDTSSEVLDELYRVTKEFTRNRKEAQKIIKDLIKVVMKLGILYRNGQFSPEELALMERFRKKVHHLAMTAVSFYQIDFTFDRRVMATALHECRDLLHQAVNTHLTSKSHSRINRVFNHFADYEFLAALYGPSEPYRSHLRRICDGINKMLDEDSI